VFPLRYRLSFYIPEDRILHSHCHENPVFVPHRKHVSATEPNWLMLYKIGGFDSGDYEECHLLEDPHGITSQEDGILQG
jgi:hypothetical protein